MDGPGGFHLDAPWSGFYGQSYLPGKMQSGIGIWIAPAVLERIKASPIELHLTFAISRLKAGPASRPIPTGEFAAAGLGICMVPPLEPTSATLEADCRSPWMPPLTYIKSQVHEGPCGASAAAVRDASGWVGTYNPDPGMFKISPIVMSRSQLSFLIRADSTMPNHVPAFCPDTPMQFTQYALADRMQVDFTFNDVIFANLLSFPHAAQ